MEKTLEQRVKQLEVYEKILHRRLCKMERLLKKTEEKEAKEDEQRCPQCQRGFMDAYSGIELWPDARYGAAERTYIACKNCKYVESSCMQ